MANLLAVGLGNAKPHQRALPDHLPFKFRNAGEDLQQQSASGVSSLKVISKKHLRLYHQARPLLRVSSCRSFLRQLRTRDW
jgi:hypothetical protein